MFNIEYTPANFFEHLPGAIWAQVWFWYRLKDHLPPNTDQFVIASFKSGLVVTLDQCRAVYRNKYFNEATFEKNSKRFASEFMKVVSDRARRHKLPHLHMNITIVCGELKAVYPVTFKARTVPPLPPVA